MTIKPEKRYGAAGLAALCALIMTVALICACGHNGENGPAASDTATGTAADGTVTTAVTETPAALSGWFDYGSALYQRDKFEQGTKQSIEIQMAKNEAEGFQYLLTSDKDVDGLRCDVAPLSDGQGHTLSGTVNVVWYLWINKSDAIHDSFVWQPAAMLPMDDEYQGGSFDVAANTCRTLYVNYKTDADTVPGTYTGKLTVSKDGRELLSGDVSVRVRDVYYDDKTECLTMIGLGYDKQNGDPNYPAGPESAPALGFQHDDGNVNMDLLLEYAWFLLDNRFCTTWLPFENDLLSENFDEVKRFINSPRFTGSNISSFIYEESANRRATLLDRTYRIAEENGWLDKLYFARFDEPHNEEQFQYIVENAKYVKNYFDTTNFLDAFNTNISADGKNIVERMSEYSTAYCPLINMFTGELKESLLRLKRERGDTLFWYTCGSGRSDGFYSFNCLPCTPGTDKRLMFWSQYQEDVDGFLYWSATTWNFCENVWAEDYLDTDFKFPKSDSMATDDGVLIYWHPVTKKPVTTLGFEAMRDGVEDFQLFKTAEAALGREKILEIIGGIVTDVGHYASYESGSTELLNELRNSVFDLIEAAA